MHFRCNTTFSVFRQPLLALREIRRNFVQVSSDPGKPFVKLRYVRIKRMDLLRKNRRDMNCDVGAKRIRTLKVILEIEEHGVLFESWSVSRHVGNGEHVCRILHEYTWMAVIWMVIDRPWGDHHVDIPIAHRSDDL